MKIASRNLGMYHSVNAFRGGARSGSNPSEVLISALMGNGNSIRFAVALSVPAQNVHCKCVMPPSTIDLVNE